ncbi:Plastid-targeted protein 3 [Forsythia ovata]|uniref:Plastid-targeted protein 3 n=1 Tax=Forsythia ovata TaxID=205694 RepID=A0ABD1PY31_9LAMI
MAVDSALIVSGVTCSGSSGNSSSTTVLPELNCPLRHLQIPYEVDTAVETIEEITEVVEKAAEVVDKVAENIADHLPEGGKFRKTIDFIENVAEKTAKDAQLVEDIINKIQKVEEDVESIVGSLNGKANKPSK